MIFSSNSKEFNNIHFLKSSVFFKLFISALEQCLNSAKQELEQMLFFIQDTTNLTL